MSIFKLLKSEDASKWIMVVPQIMMLATFVWPLGQNRCTIIVFCIMFSLLVFLEGGQLVYFILNFRDINKMAAAMSTVSTTLQAITKFMVVFINSKKLKTLINTVLNDFWPSNLVSHQLEKSLASISRLVFFGMASVFLTGLMFGLGAFSVPILRETRSLPLPSSYPFDWYETPLFELVYTVQFFTNCYVAIISICGHDNIFFVLVRNCISQFEILKEVLMKIGSGEERKYNKLLGVGDKDFEYKSEEEEEMELLIKCIRHHNKIIRFCEDIQEVFSISLFVQLLASVTAICVSSFLLTRADIDKNQWYNLASYCLGHVIQLYLFCAAGNELTYQSMSVGDYAFASNWCGHGKFHVRKGLILMIQRSHRKNKLAALNAVVLNYNTFTSVLRLSFSLYTLMSNITEK